MNLLAVMAEVGDALDEIDGLRVHRHPVKRVTPPAAVVGAPDAYEYDATMRRGTDRVTLPVVLLVGGWDAKASWQRLAAYLDGAGTKSVKAVLEARNRGDVAAGAVRWEQFDSLRVTGAEFDVVELAAVEYLAAIVMCDIAGPGA